MKVVRIADVETRDDSDNKIFNGRVSIQHIIGERTNDFRVIVVHFNPGAESGFHTYTADHVLYVTEGKGIIATESEEVTLSPGTIVHIPAGERHKHGATKNTAASQVAIMPPGDTSL